MVSRQLAEELKLQAVEHLRDDFLPRIEEAVRRLNPSDLWWRPNQASNSVGNLLLHMSGNLRQWIISGLGRRPDVRTRDAEFAARGGHSAEELLGRLRETVEEACAVFAGLTEEQLLATYRIQVYDVSGVKALVHVVEHFSHHAGQILYITKSLKNLDLGFYANLNPESETE